MQPSTPLPHNPTPTTKAELTLFQEAELEFRTQARRNRLTGLWAAEAMELAPDAAASYARGIVALGVDGADDSTLIERLRRDLIDAGVAVDAFEIEKAFCRHEVIARTALEAEFHAARA